MKKEIAKEISVYLNTPMIIDTLKKYIDGRRDEIMKSFKSCQNDTQMHQLQGALLELDKLETIRDDALAVVNLEMKR